MNLIFRQVLQAVEEILKNLSEIETENYQNPLPHFAITEFERIALAINHLNRTLHTAQQENSRLTLHALEVAETQRQTLAQELHDELGQSLTAIKVMAVTGKKTTPNQPEIYQHIIEVCEHLFGVVRLMMRQLHPLILTELGLTASLHDLIQHWQSKAVTLKLILHSESTVDKIDTKIAIQIFRIVQEAITNTVRHAQAQQLTINLSIANMIANPHKQKQSCLLLTIADNGKGCDVQNLPLGFGLLGIQARVKSLGGQTNIQTAKNQGLQLIITIPIAQL